VRQHAARLMTHRDWGLLLYRPWQLWQTPLPEHLMHLAVTTGFGRRPYHFSPVPLQPGQTRVSPHSEHLIAGVVDWGCVGAMTIG
jgi:hypothetical protein